LLEFGARAAQAGGHRAHRDREKNGDLRGRKLLELEQDEHGTELDGHGFEDVVEQGARASIVELLIGMGGEIGRPVSVAPGVRYLWTTLPCWAIIVATTPL